MIITIRSKDDRHEFHADGSSSLLVAGLAEGYSLPYSCASGTCGSCRARLIEGSVEDLWESAPGRTPSAKSDEILLCQCKPQSDCVIELKEVIQRERSAHSPLETDAKVVSWQPLTHDVALWDIELTRPMNYQAGQFVLLGLPSIKGYRAYSIVNYDRDSRRIELLIKKKAGGGLSEALFGSPPLGKHVSVIGPLGRAVFEPLEEKNILCVAGGSGIAGMMSILSHAIQLNYFRKHSGFLFFGVRTRSDSFFLDRLSKFSAACDGALKIFVCLSDEPVAPDLARDFPDLTFEQGFVHDVALKQMTGRLAGIHAFLAGPPVAVDAAMRGLILLGKLSPRSISFDKFS